MLYYNIQINLIESSGVYQFLVFLAALCPLAVNALELDRVVISAGDGSSLADVAQPVLILDGEALSKNSGSSLGTLLEDQPGISNASFGPGVGRPVLRGMSGSRVKMMVNGHDSADLSAMSSDHAPMAEVSNARQVEVIQGPATLIYGNGAIGGVVNVLDNKIATEPVDQLSGNLGAKVSSTDQGREMNAEVNGGNGQFAFHLDGFKKHSSDYHSGDSSTKENAGKSSQVKNSDTSTEGGSIGLSWTPADKGYLGLSISQLEYDYGVPNEEDSPTRVQPKQMRYDLKSAWLNPVAGIASWHNQISLNDYQHDELTLPIVEGLFDQQTWELNSRILHQEVLGWQGQLGFHYRQQLMQLCHDHSGCAKIPDYSDQSWDGSKGSLFTQRVSGSGSASESLEFVHDTPMPETETQDLGYFLVEKKPWQSESFGSGNIELGARIDFRTIGADPKTISPSGRQAEEYYSDKSFAPITLSFASTWQITEQQRWAVSIAHAQRAPDAQELFWNGDHHATFSYQLDNPNLIEETAYTFDVNWLLTTQDLTSRIAVYHYQFNDYIYNDLKSVKDPYHQHAVYGYVQADAIFQGGEVSFDYVLNDQWGVLLQADYLKAQLTKGVNKNLPRTPPATLLMQFNWQKNNWSAEVENRWTLAQNDTAEQEANTKAYQHLNLHLNHSNIFSAALSTASKKVYEWKVGIQANNLLNDFGENHVSYLKEYAPLPGRNISLNSSISF